MSFREHTITKMGVPYDATVVLADSYLQTLIKKDITWDFNLKGMKIKKSNVRTEIYGSNKESTCSHKREK